MSDPRLSAINQIRDIENTIVKPQHKPNQEEVSFSDTLKKYIKDANDMQVEADKDIQKILPPG